MTGADKLKLAYYRSFQGVFNVGERFMAWRKPELTTGPGSIAAIPSLLAAEGVHRPLWSSMAWETASGHRQEDNVHPRRGGL